MNRILKPGGQSGCSHDDLTAVGQAHQHRQDLPLTWTYLVRSAVFWFRT